MLWSSAKRNFIILHCLWHCDKLAFSKSSKVVQISNYSTQQCILVFIPVQQSHSAQECCHIIAYSQYPAISSIPLPVCVQRSGHGWWRAPGYYGRCGHHIYRAVNEGSRSFHSARRRPPLIALLQRIFSNQTTHDLMVYASASQFQSTYTSHI